MTCHIETAAEMLAMTWLGILLLTTVSLLAIDLITGFRVLRNRWMEPRPGLILVGVENPTFSRIEDKDGDSITRVLDGQPEGAVILLSHAPRHYDAAAEAGVDLMLSGHTHGGQIWPFGYVVEQFFPMYEGQHEIGGMSLIVSRGTGTWGPRMRLWRPAEILHITLRREEDRF